MIFSSVASGTQEPALAVQSDFVNVRSHHVPPVATASESNLSSERAHDDISTIVKSSISLRVGDGGKSQLNKKNMTLGRLQGG